MVAVALILLVLVAVLTVGIAVSNPDIYDLSIFGAVVRVSSFGIFLTGAITMALTVVGLLLLRIGIRRGRARRKEIKELQAASDKAPASLEEDSTAATTSDTSTASDSSTTEPTSTTEKSSLETENGESSTTAAERQAMLDEADAITRDEPRK
jgi:cytoskeletal protein RodZ